jgi:hypothetical protein
MADRILRDELFESVRWLDLPSDTHRLAYIGLIATRADDYGNLEGGPRRLYRWMHQFTQIKSDADSIKIMSDLADADLVRRYEVEGLEYWHIPRFKNSRRYWSRKCPKSPFDEQSNQTSVENQVIAKNPTVDLQQTSRSPSRGVGVGVGVGEVQKHLRTAVRDTVLNSPGFEQFWNYYPKKQGKKDAVKAWNKLKPDEQLQVAIAKSLMTQVKSESWTASNGKFIPHAATWLNGERWNDRATEVQQPSRMGNFVI